ncbi:2-amino-4-hydroxy-6-hydroxymethyldihydropteridine diphosphokinase [Candidatus Endowatersipora endosymbiont of Watersipora subatra]|uniref:2-amino-4-hydroxy-6- hydroxymethyldihydropteridine diphosphokinase n=1 Tax=Candidatus Endowatersipora endosymbiont of Watersipora subatra TaxID=3077946 RepID=UPI00312C9006
MATVWLGLGGNIGNVFVSLAKALRRIDENSSICVKAVSTIYRTAPWGIEDQPCFYNCCTEISTCLTPGDLLKLCQTIENAGQRERQIRWGPRTIDVDILIYEGIVQHKQQLTLPHPRMLERSFALVPLKQITPDLVVGGLSINSYLKVLNCDHIQRLEMSRNWWR